MILHLYGTTFLGLKTTEQRSSSRAAALPTHSEGARAECKIQGRLSFETRRRRRRRAYLRSLLSSLEDADGPPIDRFATQSTKPLTLTQIILTLINTHYIYTGRLRCGGGPGPAGPSQGNPQGHRRPAGLRAATAGWSERAEKSLPPSLPMALNFQGRVVTH